MAARLYSGLDPFLRENQYGFRRGRSTNEAIFLIRRLQDLVDAKRNQALFLLFLDWSKAFDTIKPAALHVALERVKIPARMCSAIRDLTASPYFEVVVNGELSSAKKQASGIRQGCTLSPLLFIALQTVMFHDIERVLLGQHPLAITPTVPFLMWNSLTLRFSFLEIASTCNTFFIWYKGKQGNTTCTLILASVS